MATGYYRESTDGTYNPWNEAIRTLWLQIGVSPPLKSSINNYGTRLGQIRGSPLYIKIHMSNFDISDYWERFLSFQVLPFKSNDAISYPRAWIMLNTGSTTAFYHVLCLSWPEYGDATMSWYARESMEFTQYTLLKKNSDFWGQLRVALWTKTSVVVLHVAKIPQSISKKKKLHSLKPSAHFNTVWTCTYIIFVVVLHIAFFKAKLTLHTAPYIHKQ